MSSDKKRQTRLQGACTYCKAKKVRCDSAIRPDNVCSNCLKEDITCTHGSKKKRGPRTGSSIRKHSTSIQAIINGVIAEPETYAMPEDPNIVRKMLLDLSYHARSLERQVSRWRQVAAQQGSSVIGHPAAEVSTNILGCMDSDDDSDKPDSDSNASDSDSADLHLSGSLKDLRLITGGKDPVVRHYGKTSNMVMIKTVVKIRKEILGDQLQLPSADIQRRGSENMLRRQQFWSLYPWQLEGEEQRLLTFPENDLLCELVTLYFVHVQPYIPLLHRPTFERAVAEGLHLRNARFGTVLLGVCAVASRFSRDPRNAVNGTGAEHSLGWPWYKQTLPLRAIFAEVPTLYDLQTCCLSAMYLMGTSASIWNIVGLGIRIAQDMGLHRRKKRRPDGPTTWRTMESELCTRAFWVLLNFDVILSISFGRPRATNSEDFDLELPMECDDEYWEIETPEQPAGVPSKISFFVRYCKLLEILGFAHRALYPTNKSKYGKYVGVNWEQNAVIEIDSALNQWSSSVPEYLKWDPSKPDGLFFRQSAALITFYYWTQMQVHGRFLRELSEKNGYSLPEPASPNMTICANAARCCARVIDLQRRHQFQLPAMFIAPVFSTAIILLLCNWTKRKTQELTLSINKETLDVNSCLEIMAMYEKIYQTAGRLHDILRSVIAMGDQHFQDNGASLETSNITSPNSTTGYIPSNQGYSSTDGFASHTNYKMGTFKEGAGSSTEISSASASPFLVNPNLFGTGEPGSSCTSSDMYSDKHFGSATHPGSESFGEPLYWQMDSIIHEGGFPAASEGNWSSFMEQVDEILHSAAVGNDTKGDNNFAMY